MGGVMVKSFYQQMLSTVLPYKHKDTMENDLAQYEEDLQQILDVSKAIAMLKKKEKTILPQ